MRRNLRQTVRSIWIYGKSDLGPTLLPDVLPTFAVSAVLFTTLSIAAADLEYSALLVIWLFSYTSILVGRMIFTLSRTTLNPSAQLCAEFLLGLAILSTAMLGVCIVGRVSANASLVAVCGTGVVSAALSLRGPRFPNINYAHNYGALTGACALSVIWSAQAILSFPQLRDKFVFPAWQDFFFHSSMITEFAHFSAMQGTWIFIHGVKIPVYHYSSYMLPAAIGSFSQLPALAIATAFAVPFSFFVLALGAWVLGVTMAGVAGGKMSIAAILMVPDAAYYWFKNPYYDFHWLLSITPSMAAAIGLAFLALALIHSAGLGGSLKPLALAAGLTIVLASYKIQLFVLLVLACLLLVMLLWRPKKVYLYCVFLGSTILLIVIAVAAARFTPRAPQFLSWHFEMPRLLSVLPPFGNHSDDSTVITFVAKLVSFLLTAFGALLPLYLAGLVYRRKSNTHDPFDVVPLAFIIAYCSMILTFPQDAGDEFQHRPFVLVYAVLAIWCASFAARALKDKAGSYSKPILVLLYVAVAPIPFLLQRTSQSGLADWMQPPSHIAISQGLFKSEEYIRQHSSISDVILKSGLDGDGGAYIGSLTAISERSAYVLLLRNDDVWHLWGAPLALINARKYVSNAMLQAHTFERLHDIATTAGISWYILSPGDHLPVSVTKRAVLAVSGYFVFRTSDDGAEAAVEPLSFFTSILPLDKSASFKVSLTAGD